MRYVQINSRADVWADSIIFSRHRKLQEQGHESWVFWARGEHEQDEYAQKIASHYEVCLDALLTRFDGRAGFHSKSVTRRLLRKLDEIDPDVVHLHVLCGYWINVEMLFNWLAVHRCKVIWTLHDCWAFTGHCIYFTYVNCTQWSRGCAAQSSCPQRRSYPETYLGGNRSVSWCYEQKKRLFNLIPPERMLLITPSKWLASLVKQSFLAKYNVRVVHNRVNTDAFKPTPSNFRERYGIGERFMILGVASKWSERKGLDDFIRLAGELDPEHFAVVVVGLNKKQIKLMPSNVIALPRTETLGDLVKVYSAANLLFNPTKEENFPTVNLESEACGTPVVSYDTGGCRETLSLGNSVVVGGFSEALSAIRGYCLAVQ